MKVKFNFNRRYNMFITLFACAAGLWLMVMRFGLPLETLLLYAAISVGFIFCFALLAAILAFIIRYFSDK